MNLRLVLRCLIDAAWDVSVEGSVEMDVLGEVEVDWLLSVSLSLLPVVVAPAALLERTRGSLLLRSSVGEPALDSGGENIPWPERAKLPSEGELK